MTNGRKSFVQQRTSDNRVPEMLCRAVSVSASATFYLGLAEWCIRVYLVAKCRGQETSRHILQIIWMIAI